MTDFTIIDYFNENHQPWMIIGTAVAIVCTILFYRIIKDQNEKKFATYPDPLPQYGAFEFFSNFVGPECPMFLLDVCQRFKLNSFRIPGPVPVPFFIVAEPEAVRKVLENSNSTKPKMILGFLDKATGGGDTFISSNGLRSSHVRKSTTAAFSPQNVLKMEAMVYEVLMSDNFHKRWKAEYASSPPSTEDATTRKNIIPMDVDEEMTLLTTHVISKVAFDYDMSNETGMYFISMMRCAVEGYFRQSFDVGKMIVPWLYKDMRASRRAALEMSKFGHEMIANFRNNPNPKKHTLMYMILNDPHYKSDDERARDILVYFFAGFETTAHGIAWALLELAKHPKEQEKLYQALMKYQHEHRQKGEGGKGEEIAKKKERMSWKYCTELKNVTREILRLHAPAAMGSGRQLQDDIPICVTRNIDEVSTTETTIASSATARNKTSVSESSLADGASISTTDASSAKDEWRMLPKNSYIIVPLYVMLRNEHIFSGPNNEFPADEFCPSRWDMKKGDDVDDGEEKERLKRMQLAFLPFAAGKRNCQAMALAQTELNTVVAYMVSNYHLSVIEEGKAQNIITLQPKGMRLSITPRQHHE